MKTRATLGKTERLKSRKLTEQLFSEGKIVTAVPLKVHYVIGEQNSSAKNNIPVLQSGFGVSSRHFKKAVDRNRIKRLLRESYRVLNAGLYNALEEHHKQGRFFFIYTGKELPEYTTVKDKMTVLMSRLTKTAHENNTSHT